MHVKKITTEDKIFFLSLIVGILLRILTIGQKDFWFDEAFTYHIAELTLRDLLFATLTDNNPSLYYLLIHFVLKIGQNEIILRLPSLLINLATIIALYIIVKKYLNKKIGLIAASLFSLSPLSIYLATETRPHGIGSLLSLFMVASFFALIKNPKRKTAIIFCVASISGFYTHFYTTLLLVPFSWITFLSRNKKLIKIWVIMLAVLFFAFAPWIILSLQSVHSSCSCPPTFLSFPSAIVSPAIAGVGHVSLNSFLNLSFSTLFLFSITTITTIILFLRGLFKNTYFSPLYMGPLFILSVLGSFFPLFSPKAYAVFSSLYLIIVAIGISQFRQSTKITIILLLLLGSISIIQATDPFFAGEKIKPIYEIVKQHQEYPVAHTSLLTYYSLSYYSQDKQSQILLTKNPLSPATLAFIGGHQQELDKNIERLWLVDTEKWSETKDRETALRSLFDNYEIEKTYLIGNISVRWLERK